MSGQVTTGDELKRLEQRKADEAIFREAWRNWRQGRTREEAETKAAWLLANGATVCAGVARRELSKVQSVGQRMHLECNAVSAFANCGLAVAHVRGSHGPEADV
jgi:hypothetical protein